MKNKHILYKIWVFIFLALPLYNFALSNIIPATSDGYCSSQFSQNKSQYLELNPDQVAWMIFHPPLSSLNLKADSVFLVLNVLRVEEAGQLKIYSLSSDPASIPPEAQVNFNHLDPFLKGKSPGAQQEITQGINDDRPLLINVTSMVTQSNFSGFVISSGGKFRLSSREGPQAPQLLVYHTLSLDQLSGELSGNKIKTGELDSSHIKEKSITVNKIKDLNYSNLSGTPKINYTQIEGTPPNVEWKNIDKPDTLTTWSKLGEKPLLFSPASHNHTNDTLIPKILKSDSINTRSLATNLLTADTLKAKSLQFDHSGKIAVMHWEFNLDITENSKSFTLDDSPARKKVPQPNNIFAFWCTALEKTNSTVYTPGLDAKMLKAEFSDSGGIQKIVIDYGDDFKGKKVRVVALYLTE